MTLYGLGLYTEFYSTITLRHLGVAELKMQVLHETSSCPLSIMGIVRVFNRRIAINFLSVCLLVVFSLGWIPSWPVLTSHICQLYCHSCQFADAVLEPGTGLVWLFFCICEDLCLRLNYVWTVYEINHHLVLSCSLEFLTIFPKGWAYHGDFPNREKVNYVMWCWSSSALCSFCIKLQWDNILEVQCMPYTEVSQVCAWLW